MNAIVFKYVCGQCGKEFNAPGVSDFAYGQFVMWSEQSGDPVYLDALSDTAFDEVADIVRGNPRVQGRSERDQTDIIQGVFGVTCDRSPKGELYRIGARPKCSACGSRHMKEWDVETFIHPWPLPAVTHEAWSAITLQEKTAIIDRAIREFEQGRRGGHRGRVGP